MATLISPFQYFADPQRARPIFNGFIYIGRKDGDPTNPSDQIQVRVICECGGTPVNVSQPIRTGPGGIPVYNGSPAQIDIPQAEFSLTVQDQNRVQVYHSPRVLGTTEGAVNVRNLGVQSGVDASDILQATFDRSEVRAVYFPPDLDVLVKSEININNPVYIYGQNSRLQIPKLRVKTSNFTIDGMFLDSGDVYIQAHRGIQILAFEDNADYENIAILNCSFRNYFYATDLRGRGYSVAPDDPTNRRLENILIHGCTSRTWVDRNAGNFQNTGVTNVKISDCACYGGQNATSYNFINGNGFIIVSNCFDNENDYGSLEIENNLTSFVVVSGCNFRRALWIDDTSNVSITGNTVDDRIYVTAESNDVNNINISGNNVNAIRCEDFGANPTGKIIGLNITGNYIRGGLNGAAGFGRTQATHAIFLDNNVARTLVETNFFRGTFTNCVAHVRSSDTNLTVRNNSMNAAILLSSSGGVYYEYGNLGVTTKPKSDQNLADIISDALTPNINWMNLPSRYFIKGGFINTIAGNGGSEMQLVTVPEVTDVSCRTHDITVNIRNRSNNNFSSFKLIINHRRVGNSMSASVSNKYAMVGVDVDDVAVTVTSITGTSFEIVFTNSDSNAVAVAYNVNTSNRISSID